MFKTTLDFDNSMALILNAILKGNNLQDIEDKLGQDDFNEAALRCHELKLVIGLPCTRCANNKISVQLNNPKVTYEGLQFLGL